MVRKKNVVFFVRHFISFIALLLCFNTPLSAGDPFSAYYSSDTDKLLWFIHASDPHIGTSGPQIPRISTGSLVKQRCYQPELIVVTGDLTDSTNGNLLGYPNGPYQAEWDQYKSILTNNGVDANIYYDIPETTTHIAINTSTTTGRIPCKDRQPGRHKSPGRGRVLGTYHFLGLILLTIPGFFQPVLALRR